MKNIPKIRENRLIQQNGRCYYCQQPMWTQNPADFAKRYQITAKQARHLQATAEHVVAKSEGGKDVAANIVAACRHCNEHRHHRKVARSAEAHRKMVIARMASGKWHPVRLPVT